MLTKMQDLWGAGDLTMFGAGSKFTPYQLNTDRWKSVSGNLHFLGVKQDGTLWATGDNTRGQLGLGDKLNRQTLTQVGTSTDWVSVKAGYYTSFAIKTDGTLWATGENSRYELGLGDAVDRIVFTQVGTLTGWTFATSPTGGSIGYSLGLRSGRRYEWGGNLWSTPQDRGSTDAVQVVSGAGTDFLRYSGSDGTGGYDSLFGRGENSLGQLGDGKYLDTSSFSRVATNVAKVCHVSGSTFILKTDGTIWSTGYNVYGQLGLGDTTTRNTFTQIGTSTDWVDIEAFAFHVAAIKSDGTVWTWGWNDSYRLGLGDTTNRWIPTQVGSSTDWSYAVQTTNATIFLKKVIEEIVSVTPTSFNQSLESVFVPTYVPVSTRSFALNGVDPVVDYAIPISKLDLNQSLKTPDVKEGYSVGFFQNLYHPDVLQDDTVTSTVISFNQQLSESKASSKLYTGINVFTQNLLNPEIKQIYRIPSTYIQFSQALNSIQTKTTIRPVTLDILQYILEPSITTGFLIGTATLTLNQSTLGPVLKAIIAPSTLQLIQQLNDQTVLANETLASTYLAFSQQSNGHTVISAIHQDTLSIIQNLFGIETDVSIRPDTGVFSQNTNVQDVIQSISLMPLGFNEARSDVSSTSRVESDAVSFNQSNQDLATIQSISLIPLSIFSDLLDPTPIDKLGTNLINFAQTLLQCKANTIIDTASLQVQQETGPSVLTITLKPECIVYQQELNNTGVIATINPDVLIQLQEFYSSILFTQSNKIITLVTWTQFEYEQVDDLTRVCRLVQKQSPLLEIITTNYGQKPEYWS